MIDHRQNIDFIFVHVPKLSSYYKPLDEFMFINYIPMGVFALCDILNKNKISARIKHLGIEYIKDNNFSIAEYVKENNIKLVGLSIHWHYQSFDVIEVARKIKDVSPETKIILGGITASRFAMEIMENYDFIDFIIAGDGEKGVLELAQAIEAGKDDYAKVANCLYRKDGAVVDNGITYLADYDNGELKGIEYANLSYLDYHEEYRDYFKVPLFWSLNASVKDNVEKKISGAMTTFPLMVGRGCAVNCSFCGGGRDAQKKFCKREKPVFRPVNDVVDTMEQAIGYGYESFIICFDPYPHDDSYFIEFFAEVRRRKIACGMGFESWDLPTERFVKEFGETFDKKTSYIALSPETFSERVRKINKGMFYTNEAMCNIMQLMKDEEIPILLYMTIGLSGETAEDIDGNVQYTKDLRKRFKNAFDIILVPVQLEPGSPLFEEPEKYGAVTERKCFKDFYEYHKRPESNPYSYLGYATESIQEAACDLEKFNEFINNERCEHFCIMPIKLFGKFHIPGLQQFVCKMSHKRWQKNGHGKPLEERRMFQ